MTQPDFALPDYHSRAIIPHFWHMYIYFCSTHGKKHISCLTVEISDGRKKGRDIPFRAMRTLAGQGSPLLSFFLAEKKKKE
jgi:hypothetical protein